MEGRLTRTIGLTKVDASSRLDARIANERVRVINADLDLIDAAIGAVSGGVPGPHHATHEPGGSDAMAVNAAATVGSLRTLGTGATQAATGNHTHAAPAVPEARVYHTANQSTASGVLLPLLFNSERFDTDGIHDTATNTSRLTCRTAGKYLLFGAFEMTPGGTGFRQIGVLLNGAAFVVVQTMAPATNVRLAVSTVWDLAVNDYVELCATQDSGGPLNVTAASNYSPEFGMVRLG